MEYSSSESDELLTLEEIRESFEQFEKVDLGGMMAHFAISEETSNEV